MLKWSAGLAAAGVVGVGVGYGASELLRPIIPIPGAVTTKTETSTVISTVTALPPQEEEKSFVQNSIGGVLRVYVKNGRVTRVEPIVLDKDDAYPKYVIEARGKKFEQPHEKSLIHAFGQTYRRWVYAPNRLRYPMKRVGWEPGGKSKTYDNRGLGEFVRISWDEAYTLVANEMKRIKETYGNSAILKHGGAHKILGMLGGEGSGPLYDKLINTFGGATVTGGIIDSWLGHLTGATFVWGHWFNIGSYPQDYPPHMSCFKDLLTDTLRNSNLVVYWGWDGTKIEGFKQGHEAEHHMKWVREAGIKTVSIAPDFNKCSAFHADKHIAVPAGYDTPMALAIAHVWFTEDTWDKKFVATHAVGVEKFQDYVLGRTDGVPKSPEWAQKICGVKAREIKALAREWAKGPTMLSCQIAGPQKGWYGHEWSRLMHILQALQGNIGRPGGGIWNAVTGAPWCVDYKIPYKRDGGWFAVYKMPPNPVKQWIISVRFDDAILNPPITWNGGTDSFMNRSAADYDVRRVFTYPAKGYSPVKMILSQGTKLHTAPDMGRRALVYTSPSIETSVLVNIWMEPLCRYFDILLPANTNFERDDLGGFPSATGWTQHEWAVYSQKCIEPLFESKDEVDIFVELGKKLGIDLLEGKTRDQSMQAIFEWSSIKDWISLEDFKKKGYVHIPFPKDYWQPPDPPDGNHYNPVLSWFYKKPVGEGLVTPSGKLEIYSQSMAEWYGENDPEISPIPKWYDPKVMRPKTWGNREYPLIAMLDHPTYRYHSMFENIAWLRELYKVKGPDGYEYEPIYINPVDATARGIKDGDIVRVYNKAAEVLAGARPTEKLIPGTVRFSYGAYYNPVDWKKPSLDRGGSANVILSSETMSKHANCVMLTHSPVQVEKWRGK